MPIAVEAITPDAAILASLARLHASAFAPPQRPWAATEIGALARTTGALLLVAGPAAPAGFALFRRAADEAELLTLAVAPAHRRLGIGRDLVKAGLERLAAQGVSAVWLEVAEDNAAALALYYRIGFRQIARRSAYYGPGSGGGALVLRRGSCADNSVSH